MLPIAIIHIIHSDLVFGMVILFIRAEKNCKIVVPIKNNMVVDKTHQTFRLMYLRDAVLLRYLDDPTLNSLNQYVLTNNVAVLGGLDEEPDFFVDLVTKLREYVALTRPPGGCDH